MTDRTGLDPLELGVLSVYANLGAGPDSSHVQNNKVLARAVEVTDVGPRYVWDVLRDLARPWRAPLPLIDFHGNYLPMDHDPAIEASYTESTLSYLGVLVLEIEAGDAPPAPLGLINGDTYKGGSQPPFGLEAVARTIRRLRADPAVSSATISRLLGPPVFPGGCNVVGDLAGFRRGRPTTLTLTPHITVIDGPIPIIELTHLPPDVDASVATKRLAFHFNLHADMRPGHYHVDEVRDRSTGTVGSHEDDRIQIVLTAGADPARLLAQITKPPRRFSSPLLDELHVNWEIAAHLPKPLPQLVRDWVDTYGHEDLDAGLTALETAAHRVQAARANDGN